MNTLVNAIKAHAGALDNCRGECRFAIVKSVDPNKYMVRVSLQPENTLTGWLPILSPYVGNGWGIASSLAPGNQVFVIPWEGDVAHGVVVGGTFSSVQRPPVVPAGEYWIVHETGCALKLSSDGTVRVSGNLMVDGDVFDRQGSLAELRSVYNAHIHTDSRGGSTSTPTKQA